MRARRHEPVAPLLRSVGSDLGRLGAAGLYLSAVVGPPPAVALLAEPGWLRPSVEVAALAGGLALLAALGRPLGPRARAWLAAAILALTLLAAADMTVRAVYDRPLNLAVDLAYVPFLAGFLGEAMGGWRLAGAAAAGLVGAAALFALNLWALRALGEAVARPRGRRALAGLLAAAVVVAWAAPAAPGAGCPAGSGLACRPWRLAGDQLRAALDLWRPLPGLDDAADPYARPVPGRLAGLGGADVVLAFVESYGETVFRRPDHAAVVGPALAEIEAGLTAAGLGAVSGYLVSPTVGGLSWLAHGTLLAGVWLENDLYHRRLVRGGRTTLVEDFNRAGYHTLGVFPQIDGPWPEAAFFRYRDVHTFQTIPYAGPPFGWTTMPDQYSLWFVERERRRIEAPVFVELALVSSHAPWEPIPPLIGDWEALGDGEAFAGLGDAGGPANWPHDAAANYPRAVAYTLRALGAWAAEFLAGDGGGGGRGGLLVALGDHQPASLITGAGASRAVPIHVIAADPALLAPFLDWGFTPGMVPGPDAATHRMDAFRARLHAAYGADGATAGLTDLSARPGYGSAVAE